MKPEKMQSFFAIPNFFCCYKNFFTSSPHFQVDFL
jgi:hypothetical protein